ncbi:MAG: phosphonopyruvate decarboxylase [Polyangiaceae bacterium]|nr:phosphonopyruvate decarboxylase [Polyangiaceae bacterium]
MLSCQAFFDVLHNQGVTLFAGVPDSLLKDFCAYVTDNAPAERHVITANEGGAIALAMGHHLATGEIGCVYMQNSGLGNTVNPLTSLADPAVYGIPMLLLIGWRGRPGEKDEPQHVQMGRVTKETLTAIGVEHSDVPDSIEVATQVVARAIESAKKRSAPHALVIKKGTFDSYKLKRKDDSPYQMTREAAIERIVAKLPAEVAIVATTGMPSRELFEIREKRKEAHRSDFLTVGGMGHASQIALGVALAKPARTVVCLDGDGAALMHMGGLSTIGQLAPKNYRHIVLNNGAHDSVGGQPTVAFAVDLLAIAKACGYTSVARATNDQELTAALDAFVRDPGPSLLEVRVKKGARADLGRPTQSTQDLTRDFSGFVRNT